jgi:hypothetical protein
MMVQVAEKLFLDLLEGKTMPGVEKQAESHEILKKITVSPEIFFLDDIHPLIYMESLDVYGKEWPTWLPETLRSSVKKDFKVTISDEAMNKINAVQVLLCNKSFWSEWHIFEKCGNAFNGNLVNFGSYQPLNISELAFTVQVANAIDALEAYAEEIIDYMAVSLKDRGFLLAPDGLIFVQKRLDELNNLDNNYTLSLRAKWEEMKNKINPTFEAKNIVDLQVLKLLVVKESLGDYNQLYIKQKAKYL